jgi:hypothetical protein
MSARSSEYRDATVAKCLSPCTKISRLELLGMDTTMVAEHVLSKVDL